MRTKYILIGVVIGVLFSSMAVVLAGNLIPPGEPTDADAQMYTLKQIYDRLKTGATTPKMGTFTEPDSGPGETMYTLNQIMAQAPVTHTNGATSTHVLTGKPFWGLHSSEWATQTGTMPDKEGDNASTAQAQSGGVNYFTAPDGYYDGDDTVSATDAQVAALDIDISSSNIKSGVSIYGVAGDSNVVDTSSGDATAGEILSGTKAWVGGSEVTGELRGGCTCSGTLYATRWCDNGDGTVTDLTTCLVWAQDASWGGAKAWRCESSYAWCSDDWDDAHKRASSYDGYMDDWRLPTIAELNGLVNGTPALRCSLGTCDLYAFTGVQSVSYWSSTSFVGYPGGAWYVALNDDNVSVDNKEDEYYVWPVRGGQ